MIMRFATVDDGRAIRTMYAPYIENTVITFENDVPSIEEMAERIASVQKTYPWIVAEQENSIIGYAYASALRSRAAYQWCAELSVYLDPEQAGHGYGAWLYDALMQLLRLQGIRVVYGVVAVPNAASERLHQRFGFKQAGLLTRCGYKLGQWIDVAYYEKRLIEDESRPDPIKPVGTLDQSTVRQLLTDFSKKME